jgi:hypothetical protein
MAAPHPLAIPAHNPHGLYYSGTGLPHACIEPCHGSSLVRLGRDGLLLQLCRWTEALQIFGTGARSPARDNSLAVSCAGRRTLHAIGEKTRLVDVLLRYAYDEPFNTWLLTQSHSLSPRITHGTERQASGSRFPTIQIPDPASSFAGPGW